MNKRKAKKRERNAEIGMSYQQHKRLNKFYHENLLKKYRGYRNLRFSELDKEMIELGVYTIGELMTRYDRYVNSRLRQKEKYSR